MEKLPFNLQILSIEIGFPWFCMEEISVQILEFVDRETNIHQIVPRFCMETKFFLAVFGHIFVVIGMIVLSIECQNVENELKKSISEATL